MRTGQRRVTATKLSEEGRGDMRKGRPLKRASIQTGAVATFHGEEMATRQKHNSVSHGGPLSVPCTSAAHACVALVAALSPHSSGCAWVQTPRRGFCLSSAGAASGWPLLYAHSSHG